MRRAVPVLLLAALLGAPAGAWAQVQTGCAADATCDEAQVGDHVEPDFSTPPKRPLEETRGKPLPVPAPWLGGVRYKSGAGVWLAEPAPDTNLYLNGKRNKLSIDMKLGF
ncbi:MAG TPA: hypothetical protein VIL72_06995 [Beijerinckiaceae bacterium]|jgi:hypothetical protein